MATLLPAAEPRAPGPEDVASVIAMVDSLYFAQDPAASIAACSTAFARGVDDSRLRWRAARATIALGMLSDDAESRTTFYDAALGHARRAVELSRGIDERYWLAAAAGRRARPDQLLLGVRRRHPDAGAGPADGIAHPAA